MSQSLTSSRYTVLKFVILLQKDPYVASNHSNQKPTVNFAFCKRVYHNSDLDQVWNFCPFGIANLIVLGTYAGNYCKSESYVLRGHGNTCS
jgi:hypothetical protein